MATVASASETGLLLKTPVRSLIICLCMQKVNLGFCLKEAGRILLGLLAFFHGAPAEEQLHWRTFLVKLGAENLKGAKNEELFVASHKALYIVYAMLGDVCIYVVGKDEFDELTLGEVIFAITSSVKDVCGKPPTERLFLDKYGWICPCHDEIVWTMRKSLNMRNSFKHKHEICTRSSLNPSP